MIRPVRFVLPIVGVGVVMMAGGCARRVEGTAAPDAPVVAAATVVRADLKQVLTVAAEFRPYQEVDLHAKVAGYVKSIAVDVGDRVRAGQLLAVLEIPELEQELQVDDADVRRAHEEVTRAEADLDRAQSAHDVAHLAATRLTAVSHARANLVAQQDVDDVTARDRISGAQVATAKATVAVAQAQLEAAQATQRKAATLVEYSQIRAPFTGVITKRYADPGAMIQAGTSSQTQSLPVVTLSEVARLRLVIPVPESAVPRVHVGTPVTLTVDALHRQFDGRAARFADRLDTETRTMRVEVDVDNPTFALVPGMYATAAITLDEAAQAITVPVEAIDRSGDLLRVWRIDATRRLRPTPVTLGLETPGGVQVLSGVQPGELVAIGNREQVSAGAVVTPRIATAAEGSR